MNDKASTMRDTGLVLGFAAAVLTMPIWLTPIGAGYPDLLQKFASLPSASTSCSG